MNDFIISVVLFFFLSLHTDSFNCFKKITLASLYYFLLQAPFILFFTAGPFYINHSELFEKYYMCAPIKILLLFCKCYISVKNSRKITWDLKIPQRYHCNILFSMLGLTSIHLKLCYLLRQCIFLILKFDNINSVAKL